jgi:spore maturation protein CgeB
MINKTILLLTYYYNQEDGNDRLLRHIVKCFCPAYLPWNLYLYEPLQKIFSKVILYDYLKRRAEIGLTAVNEEVIGLVRREHPNYVLWTSFYDDIQNSTLEAIRSEGAKVIGWFFDDEVRFNSYSKCWTPYLDYCVTNAISAVPGYRQLGARVIQTIPNTGIAVDPDWPHLEERRNLTFVGSIGFNDRRRYVNELRKRNIPVEVFGEGSGGYVSFEQMLDIFRTSKINLNFSKCGGYYWLRQIKGRVFQICLAGGFLLTEHAPGIEKYFELDKEIVCFDTAREMVDKVRYYLNHEAERQAIARAGWERATREYTSCHMVAKVFDEVEEDLVKTDKKNDDLPAKLRMPIRIRRVPARCHFEWGRALIEEKDNRAFWKDDLALSLSYSPLNIWTWYYRVLGLLPSFARVSAFYRLYSLQERSRIAALRWLSSVAFLRRMTEGLFKRLW